MFTVRKVFVAFDQLVKARQRRSAMFNIIASDSEFFLFGIAENRIIVKLHSTFSMDIQARKEYEDTARDLLGKM